MRGTEIVLDCQIREVPVVDDRKLLESPESERRFEVLDEEGRKMIVWRRDLAEFDLKARRLVFLPELRAEENAGTISILNQDGELVAEFPKELVVSVRQIGDEDCQK